MDRPVERNLAPHWDLSVVLDPLTKSPFERRDMEPLTLKTVFLLSLAIGARRRKIHTLYRSGIRWSADGQDVFLRPYMGFVFKTQVAHEPLTAWSGFWVKSLAATMSSPNQIGLFVQLEIQWTLKSHLEGFITDLYSSVFRDHWDRKRRSLAKKSLCYHMFG